MLRTTLYGALAASLLLAGADTADAQFASPIRLSVFGGAALPMGDFGSSDGTNPDAGFADLGFRLGAGLELRVPLFPFGLRVDGAFDQMPLEGGGGNWRVLSGTANAVFSPMMSPIYFIGGIGAYNVRGTVDGGVDVLDSQTRFGFNLGAGFQLPVPMFSPFIEARWNRVNLDVDGGSTNIDYLPIVFGIRF